jgi:hypothetical protein
MPLNLQLKVVSLYDSFLPSKTASALQLLPATPQVMYLIGGGGGDAGEKSRKPQIQFAVGSQDQSSSFLDVQTSSFYIQDIKEENDCGHALKIVYDNSNKSEINFGYINPASEVNIYNSSAQLKFANLYSGVADSKTAGVNLSNGASVNDFTILTNGTETVSVVQDTELNLNKNYISLNGSTVGDTCSKFLIKNFSSASSDTTSLLNVFVNEIDVNDGYVSYIDSGTILNTVTSGTITITIETGKLFSAGDVVIVGNIYNDDDNVYGTVTSYNSGTGLLSFTFEGAGRIFRSNLSAGSFVTILYIYKWSNDRSHCISTTWTDSETSTYSSLREAYSAGNIYGFRFKHKRSKTNNNISDYNNTITWTRDNMQQFFDSSGVVIDLQRLIAYNGVYGDPTFTYDRVGNRNYLKSQYDSLSQLISKNKFSIIYNGFYQFNKQFKYFHGYYKNNVESNLLQNNMLTDPKNYKITVGSGAFKDASNNFRPYFTHKLYEVLSYRNLQDLNTGNPQKIIVDYLIEKYKQKAFFGSSVEIQNSKDIYYSQVDRPNLFGKIRKIIS